MSVYVIDWVANNSSSKGGARLVLIMMAWFADHGGEKVYPSLEKLATRCNMSVRQVRTHVRKLEKLGEIERVGRHEIRGKEGYFTYQYRIKGVEYRQLGVIQGGREGGSFR